MGRKHEVPVRRETAMKLRRTGSLISVTYGQKCDDWCDGSAAAKGCALV